MVIVATGLLGASTGLGESRGHPNVPPTSAQLFAVESLTERTLVSEPGHKMSEFMMAKNPLDANHLILGAIDWSSESGGWRCAAYASRDGGRSWAGGIVETLADGVTSWDPWVGFGPDGQAHYTCMWRVEGQSEIAHLVSSDGGLTWDLVNLLPRIPGHDRDSFVVDLNQNIHVCFSSLEGTTILTSQLGSGTWERTGLSPEILACNGLEVLNDGTVVANVLWTKAPGTYDFGVIRSSDHGATWSPFVRAGTMVTFDDAVGAGTYARPQFAYPSIAVEPASGQIALAAQSVGSDGLLVPVVALSRDGGQTFAIVPNPSYGTQCLNCHVTRPVVTMTTSGVLGLQSLVRDISGVQGQEVWFGVTSDGGANWYPPTKVATASIADGQMSPRAMAPDGRQIVGQAIQASKGSDPNGHLNQLGSDIYGFPVSHHDGGDYWGSTGTDEGFLVTWIDASGGGPPAIWTQLLAMK